MDEKTISRDNFGNFPHLGENEPPRNTHIPYIVLTRTPPPEETLVDQNVRLEEELLAWKSIPEIERAILVTLKMLKVDFSPYQSIYNPRDLIDFEARNDKGSLTFPRKKDADSSILVLALCCTPVYDRFGKEVSALYDIDAHRISLNVPRIEYMFLPPYDLPPKSTLLALAAVEETIHFVQFSHWNRKSSGTDHCQTLENHNNDPIEKEANQLKKRVFGVLYPNLRLQMSRIDFGYD